MSFILIFLKLISFGMLCRHASFRSHWTINFFIFILFYFHHHRFTLVNHSIAHILQIYVTCLNRPITHFSIYGIPFHVGGYLIQSFSFQVRITCFPNSKYIWIRLAINFTGVGNLQLLSCVIKLSNIIYRLRQLPYIKLLLDFIDFNFFMTQISIPLLRNHD